MIRMLDHTADVGFEVVEAPTLEDLFDETRQALLMTVFEESPERGEDEDSVWLSAPDLETLWCAGSMSSSFLSRATGSSR
jgi:SHS2 domain-containing protein